MVVNIAKLTGREEKWCNYSSLSSAGLPGDGKGMAPKLPLSMQKFSQPRERLLLTKALAVRSLTKLRKGVEAPGGHKCSVRHHKAMSEMVSSQTYHLCFFTVVSKLGFFLPQACVMRLQFITQLLQPWGKCRCCCNNSFVQGKAPYYINTILGDKEHYKWNLADFSSRYVIKAV